MTDGEREHWSRLLTKVGWLFTLAELAIAAAIVNRARAVTTSSFEDGVWGQRAEILSFLSLPQNVVVLVPAAAAAAAANVDRRAARSPRSNRGSSVCCGSSPDSRWR